MKAMKRYASVYIIFVLTIICMGLATFPPVAHSATRNATTTVEYTAKEYYDLIYVQHVRSPDTAMLKFAERENNIIRGIIVRRGYCLPKSDKLTLVYYLYHVGVRFIEERQKAPFSTTKQYETFTAHEVIEVGLYYTQYINCG